MKIRLATAIAAALLAGCASGPDYRRPAVDLPAAFAAAPAAPAPVGIELLDTAWWSSFGDPKLDELVAAAVANNPDLKIAAYRVQQHDAFLQVSQSAGGPQVGYGGSRLRNTLSENRQVPLAPGTKPVDNDYAISLAASWELDLWGKVSRANEAAYAQLLASEEDRRALMQSLISEVANGYLRLLALDRLLELQKAAIETQKEQLALAERKFKGGGAGELPVLRAQAELEALVAELPAREAEIAAQENAINALIGKPPGPVARGRRFEELKLPAVPGGLPAGLLAQRPDVRKAEQDLVAANAKIGVAKSEYLPTISLTSSSGFASNDLSKLLQLTSNFGSFGAALLGPLFTSGRISGQVREAEAVRSQAEIAFLNSVQVALREVEDALTGLAKSGQRIALQERRLSTLREQRRVAQRLFEGGGSAYFEVLEAERQLNAAQQQVNHVRREQLAALVSVYKAMGGGWSLAELKPDRPATLEERR